MGTNAIALTGFTNYFELYMEVKPFIDKDNHDDFHSLIAKHIEYLMSADSKRKRELAEIANDLFVCLYDEVKDIADDIEDLNEEVELWENTYLQAKRNLKILKSIA